MAIDGHESDDWPAARYVAPLLESHGRSLVLYARQLCNDAEDAVQLAFIDLATQSAMPQDPAAWLFRAVRHKALTLARSRVRRHRHERTAGEARAGWFQVTDDDALDGQAVVEALGSLDQIDRETIVAHLWGGLTFRQIGTLLDMSASTAFRRYEAGLVLLRKRVEQPCATKS
ncbi:MAG: sigma-70 family RNA polymerase sigma factor [Planctomycetales bacterium]|nr:sigma-70 family RNA polymerase sigma factor [Planctomycetales bacterium]